MNTGPIRDATFEDMENTMRFCPDSGVGPDGLPYSAWRAAGAAGVLTLFLLYYHICSGLGVFLGFNDQYAVFLPKDIGNVDDTKLGIRESHQTRPLGLKNSDSKIIYKLFAFMMQPFSKKIHKIQRGGVKDRNFVHNVVDLDAAG